MKSISHLSNEANFTIFGDSAIGPKPAVKTSKGYGSTATLHTAS
jgi:hypothetical protein